MKNTKKEPEIVRCARCHRVLTGKAAKYWGMGSTCIRKAPGMAAKLRLEIAGQTVLWTADEINKAAKNGSWDERDIFHLKEFL